MYFVLGMLSIIGAAILATIVWGVVKISKLLKTIKQHEEWMANNERNVYDNMRHLREDLDRRMDSMDHHASSYMNELQRELDGRFSDCNRDHDGVVKELHSRIDNLQRELDIRFKDQLDESKSYTDSRFDKAASGLNGAKQLIKG